MHPFIQVIGPPRGMPSNASLVGIATSDQAPRHKALKGDWRTEEGVHHPRADQPVRERF